MRDRNFENEWDMPLIFELTYKRRNSIDIAVMLNPSRYTFLDDRQETHRHKLLQERPFLWLILALY